MHKTYAEDCSEILCNPSFLLICSGQNESKPQLLTGSTCDCPVNMFWNGASCQERLRFGEWPCDNDYMCNNTVTDLKCFTGNRTCLCRDFQS